jgi:predicted RNA-binding protein with PUA-like domain
MNYWLIKSEPNVWSWNQHLKKGVEPWHGVRNYQASNNMKSMKLGDLAFFYHSNIGKEIVGIAEVVKLYYPDHTDEKGRFGMVDFKALKSLKKPITLVQINSDPMLEGMALIKQSRLSVSPVTPKEWDYILSLSEKD